MTKQIKRNKSRRKGMNEGKLLERLLKEATYEGTITRPECGNPLEPDAEGCYCGWENLL